MTCFFSSLFFFSLNSCGGYLTPRERKIKGVPKKFHTSFTPLPQSSLFLSFPPLFLDKLITGQFSSILPSCFSSSLPSRLESSSLRLPGKEMERRGRKSMCLRFASHHKYYVVRTVHAYYARVQCAPQKVQVSVASFHWYQYQKSHVPSF